MLTRKLTSPVYEYFSALIEPKEKGKNVMKVRCKLCGVQLDLGGGTTTCSLASHLLAKYPKEYKHAFGGPSSSAKQPTLTMMVCKCSRVCCNNYQADSEVRGKRSSSTERCGWPRLPTTPEYHRDRVLSTVTHSHH